MLTLELSIRSTSSPVSAACAWLIPGGNVERWFVEIAHANAKPSSLAYLVLPTSIRNPAPAGVLIHGADEDAIPNPNPRWIGYRQVLGRIFLPIDAVFEPPLSDGEIEKLFPDESRRSVFHPSLGMVLFDEESILTATDFLAVPEVRSHSWNRARQGVELARRLISIETDLESLDEVMEGLRGDISSKSPKLKDLPRTPEESLGAEVKRGLARPWQWLASAIGAVGSASGLRMGETRLGKQIQEWLAMSAELLESLRNREIHRLMGLLERDPDKGLHFAIPLSSLPGRGMSPPTWFLSWRLPNFSLSAASGPTSFWNINPHTFLTLREKYRALAERELQLGRHRRAAYIFAMLLGDYRRAAVVLEEAGHFTEAAAIYREKLHLKLEAARCLERGGRLDEAIDLLTSLEKWEMAGDLQSRLGRAQEAEASYRREIERQCISGDLLEAARVLDEKLHSVDEALALLRSAWPRHQQAVECLNQLFVLWGRDGRHAEANQHLQELDDRSMGPELSYRLAEALVGVVNSYPSANVARLAADKTRRIIARRLRGSRPLGHARLVGLLPKMVPDDRVLASDCRRFIAKIARPAQSARVVVRSSPHLCQLEKEFDLHGEGWTAGVGLPNSLVAFQLQADRLKFMHVTVSENVSTGYAVIRYANRPDILATLLQHEDPEVIVHAPLADLESVDWKIAAPSCAYHVRVRSCRELGDEHLALATHPQGMVWALVADGLGYRCQILQGPNFLIPGSDDIIWNESGEPSTLLCFSSKHPVVGIGGTLLHGDLAHHPKRVVLEQPIRSMAGARPFARPRVITFHDQGACLVWLQGNEELVETFAMDLHQPVGAFLRPGFVVVASEEETHIYVSQYQKLQLRASAAGCSSPPVAVLPMDQSDRFAILESNGHIRVYRVNFNQLNSEI